jgi:hypothetical protein
LNKFWLSNFAKLLKDVAISKQMPAEIQHESQQRAVTETVSLLPLMPLKNPGPEGQNLISPRGV